MRDTTGIVFDIEEFAVYDGPGIRMAVFFEGLSAALRVVPQPGGV